MNKSEYKQWLRAQENIQAIEEQEHVKTQDTNSE